MSHMFGAGNEASLDNGKRFEEQVPHEELKIDSEGREQVAGLHVKETLGNHVKETSESSVKEKAIDGTFKFKLHHIKMTPMFKGIV